MRKMYFVKEIYLLEKIRKPLIKIKHKETKMTQ